MGAWGTGVFNDDLALDLKEEYQDLVAEGLSGPEATRLLMESWERELDDPDVAMVFWLSLAATQWQVGRLEEAGVTEASLEALSTLTGTAVTWEDLRRPQSQFMLCRSSEKELPAQRLERLGVNNRSGRKPGIARVVLWRNLDAYLAEVFGLT
jgi:hypothetical protein